MDTIFFGQMNGVSLKNINHEIILFLISFKYVALLFHYDKKFSFLQKSKGSSHDSGSRLNGAKKLHFEVCSLLLSSVANLEKTLSELLDVVSITASANCDLMGSKDSKDKDQILTASEKRKRFFDRSELKKVTFL